MFNPTSSLALGAAIAFTATAGLAQQSITPNAINGAVKDAGVYNVATKTWTRAGHSAAFGPKQLYDNTADSGFYAGMSVPETYYDAGRLPGGADPSLPQASGDTYTVDGFQIGYCTFEGTAGQPMTFDFYQNLASCTDPTGVTPTAAFSATGPGSSALGTQACWILTFDLAGTSLVFTMDADADKVFDNSAALDSFSWGISMTTVTDPANANGPIMAGDPNNAPFGDATYYQNPGSTIGGTGLGQADQFWLIDPSGATAAGCYWFGGYGPGNPWTGFHLQLMGDTNGEPAGCQSFCSSNPNSTGSAATITSTDGCDADGNGFLSMQASPVPNQPGIFFSGTTQIGAPFGCGLLCTAGTIVRGNVVFASGNVASYDYDLSMVGGGSGKHFQYWFRDPAHSGTCGNVFSTSDAMTKQ